MRQVHSLKRAVPTGLVLAVALCALASVNAGAQDLVPAADEIVVRGVLEQVSGDSASLRASSVRLAGESTDTLLATPASKPVTLSANTQILLSNGKAGSTQDLVTGAEVAVVGKNLGKGKSLPARAITVYLPELAPVPHSGTANAGSPSAAPPAGPPAVRVNVPLQWNVWPDPSGLQYQYPANWIPSSGVGANPVTFQRGKSAMQVRRIPVVQGQSPQQAVATASALALSTARSKNWVTSERTLRVAGVESSAITLTGDFVGQDWGRMLGVKPESVGEIGRGSLHVLYVPVPANTGREAWALEISIGGPVADAREVGSVYQRVVQTLTLGAEQAPEAPAYNSPIRAGNTVRVEAALRQVGTAIQMYFIDNDDVVPANWQALAPYIQDGTLLKSLREGWPNYGVGPVQLLAPGQRVSSLENPVGTPIAKAAGAGFDIVIFADGHIEKVRR